MRNFHGGVISWLYKLNYKTKSIKLKHVKQLACQKWNCHNSHNTVNASTPLQKKVHYCCAFLAKCPITFPSFSISTARHFGRKSPLVPPPPPPPTPTHTHAHARMHTHEFRHLHLPISSCKHGIHVHLVPSGIVQLSHCLRQFQPFPFNFKKFNVYYLWVTAPTKI